MWDLRVALPFGRLSLRNLFIFAAATIAACLVFILASSPITHADDASWNGSALTYQGNQYQQAGTAGDNDSRGLSQGTQLYTYTEPSSNGTTQKLHLIDFAPGVDASTATTANYIVYDYTPPNTYTNPTAQSTITLTPQAGVKQATSCDSSFTFGLGWIVCPITNFLANSMDWIFGIVSSFLTVRPIQSDQNSALFSIWSVMRNFANVVFVIGFIAVIYSQLTSIGLSNYNVKKMLPRLIVAAILVNISYWICSIAVDASNILGYSIEHLFMAIHDSVIGSGGNQWSVISFKSIAGFILSGGTAALAGGLALHGALAATVGGSITLLLPVLAGLLLAIFIALVVLAARQAIITVLIIVSPLAFVAFLLPNTEKYFKKWHELFSTMLIMFPMFAFVFGGAQLAGIAIIQNADSINLIILGMAVQIAPLAITPILIRLSGTLLGRIAGMANNPSKGLVDRTRKFADERAAQRKARVLANPGTRRRDFLNRTSARINNKRVDREAVRKDNEQIFETAAQERQQRAKYTDQAAYQREMTLRVNKIKLDSSNATVDANWDEFKRGNLNNAVIPGSLSVKALANLAHEYNNQAQSAKDAAIGAKVEERRAHSAQHMLDHDFAHDMEHSRPMQQRAGGIDPNGAQRALAHAVSEQATAREQTISNADAIIRHSNLDGTSTLKLALGHAQGNITATDDIREAAIKKVASGGNVDAINKLVEGMDLSPASNPDLRVALVNALRANSAARPKYIGFGKMDQMTQGIAGGFGQKGLDDAVHATINDGKFSADVLVGQDKDALVRMFQAVQRNRSSYSQAAINNLKDEVNKVYASDLLKTRVGERKDVLDDILNKL